MPRSATNVPADALGNDSNEETAADNASP